MCVCGGAGCVCVDGLGMSGVTNLGLMNPDPVQLYLPRCVQEVEIRLRGTLSSANKQTTTNL